MAEQLNALVADDERKHREILTKLLKEWGYAPTQARDGLEAVKKCAEELVDIVLLDARMPNMDGYEALAQIRKLRPDLPVIMMTAYSDLPAAIEAMRSGAWDYLAKPLDFARLQITLRNAANKIGLMRENRELAKNIEEKRSGLLGESPAMLKLAEMIAAVAPTEATVLITGESGTGKELAARAVHAASHRKNGPFVALNCGALTESLLASELFGHEKGAFTGADKKHPGLFREAEGGSIFLDEIAEMPLAMQVKLLRVLQEREVLSVGSAKAEPINCRVLAATNRDLAVEVKAGRFRGDLFYRLSVVPLTMPPLRERLSDIPLLAGNFARKFAAANHRQFSGITSEAMACLQTYKWPGNVRELENVIERAIILMPGETIDIRSLPDRLQQGNPESRVSPDLWKEGEIPSLEELEKKVILETLRRCANNKSEAARLLGITRKTLHNKLNRYRTDEDGQEAE